MEQGIFDDGLSLRRRRIRQRRSDFSKLRWLDGDPLGSIERSSSSDSQVKAESLARSSSGQHLTVDEAASPLTRLGGEHFYNPRPIEGPVRDRKGIGHHDSTGMADRNVGDNSIT